MAGYSVTFTVVDQATKQIDAINRRIAQTRAPMDRLSRQVSRFVDVSGLRKVAQGFDWIGKAAGSVLRTLTAIVPVMGAITGAASIAGMVKLVQSYSAWSRELVQSADNIGMTTQQLQKFQDATRLAGGSADDMTNGLKGLHDSLADFNIGGGGATLTGQWANKLGISLRDVNGHIRTAADLMPELIQKIGAMKDPADRAAAANALLGSSGDKLVETFRQSSQTFAQWFSDVSRYKDLTDEQKGSLQQFGEAQGRIGVAFDRLGQQLSVTLARDFTPLLNQFAKFVEKHTPDIVAAVDRISKRFEKWLEDVDWSKVEGGINSVLDGLKWVINNLDTIKTAVEAVAIVFATKWALGIVADIAKVGTALGAAGVGGVGGSGLLGSLGTVLSMANAATLAFGAMQKAYDPKTYAPENLSPNSPFWRGIPPDEQKKYPNSPANQAEKDKAAPSFTESPSGWLSHRLGDIPLGGAGPLLDRAIKGPETIQPPAPITPPAPASGPPGTGTGSRQQFYDEQRVAITDAARRKGLPNPEVIGQLGATQASLESGFGKSGIGPGGYNVYGIKAGGGVGSGSTAVMTHEEIGGQRVAMSQNFATFKDRNEAADAYVDFLQKNKRYAGVLQAKNVDEAIQAQAHSGYATASNYGSSLQATYAAHGGGPAPPAPIAQAGPPPAPSPPSTRDQAMDKAYAELQARQPPPAPIIPAAAAPPATVPPPAPVNGAVDVSITHKNAPPNSSVTASGSGSVNVAPVRVEHQDMASI